ncbi:MAG: AgmX/PglI C-terminal domain-containing protein [Deltaproteobacteria bacterium]|nr:AgmX/PglI C-terminal domain-containing protein [Deltaproteobacteria bacterium]
MKTTSILVAILATGLAGACAKTGTGPAVRADITARMTSIQQPLAACYKNVLSVNRKLKGMIVLDFRAKPGTGEFTDVRVSRDDVGDPGLQKCVLDRVGGLKLETPQKTAVQVSYPISFAPEN